MANESAAAKEVSAGTQEPPPVPPHHFKPSHVIYLILIVVGVCLMTVSIVDRIVLHYGNTIAYGKVARWLLVLTSLTAIAGGLHIWKIYQQFYLFEEKDGDAFEGWVNSPFELAIRYGLFIALICALSKANAVLELVATIPNFAQFFRMEPTAVSDWLSKAAHERLLPGHQPEHYTIGCAIMFFLLVLWSAFAVFYVTESKRFTVLIWILTDVIGTLFWVSCAFAVCSKPTDLDGNGVSGLCTGLFGVIYTLIVLTRLFLGTQRAAKIATFFRVESPSRFAL